MIIYTLRSYAEARALCEGKRFASRGRRLANRLTIRLVDRDTTYERIEMGRWAWNKTEFMVRAVIRPDDTVEVENLRGFSSHELNTLFGCRIERDSRKYQCVHTLSCSQVVRADRPVVFNMGQWWTVKSGEPMPSIEKNSDKSLEWTRAKRKMDDMVRAVERFDAYEYGHLSADERYKVAQQQDIVFRYGDHGDWSGRFAQYVLAGDLSAIQLMFVADLGGGVNGPHDCSRIFALRYHQYYKRRRTAVLVAAGARVERT